MVKVKISFSVRPSKDGKKFQVDLGEIDLETKCKDGSKDITRLAVDAWTIGCQSHVRRGEPRTEADALALAKAYIYSSGGQKLGPVEKLERIMAKSGVPTLKIKEVLAILRNQKNEK